MTREEIKDELCRMLSDVVNGGYPKRNNTQRGRYREAVKETLKVLEQEPCEDEYIKVPKKALKYRTSEMVAYNVEWLKKHFDMERAIIFGELPESEVENADEDVIATLPEGHGRLIDADELFWDIQTDEQMRLGEHLARVKERIDEAPTVIEAESEVEE